MFLDAAAKSAVWRIFCYSLIFKLMQETRTSSEAGPGFS